MGDGDADARRDHGRLGAEVDRPRQGATDAFGGGQGVRVTDHVADDDDELVAAEPCHRVARANRPKEAACDLFEQVVARTVAE